MRQVIQRVLKVFLLIPILFWCWIVSCSGENGKVLTLRVDSVTLGVMSISCVDELEITFKGSDGTVITGSSDGVWREGVTYRTESREGERTFIIVVSGDYIRNVAGGHKFDLPLKGVGGEGTFTVAGEWRYAGVATGFVSASTLSLPDPDSIFTVSIVRNPLYADNVCLTPIPDADITAEVVEDVEETTDEEIEVDIGIEGGADTPESEGGDEVED